MGNGSVPVENGGFPLENGSLPAGSGGGFQKNRPPSRNITAAAVEPCEAAFRVEEAYGRAKGRIKAIRLGIMVKLWPLKRANTRMCDGQYAALAYFCARFITNDYMTSAPSAPAFLFETSWEVCNKVGGIYTVLSSIAKSLTLKQGENLCFIGPDLGQAEGGPYFAPQATLHPEWVMAAADEGLSVRMGRWLVPGSPIVALVDFAPLYAEKDGIYGRAWELFGVDSLHAYGDYDEASMFSYAAARFAQIVTGRFLGCGEDRSVVYQAHEWMSALGMLFLRHEMPAVATVFTTHATSIGRSITGNGKNLYQYFDGYDGDQMAAELNMQSKHSVEKRAAHLADCFTTVSRFTDRECAQLLEKQADVVLPNGFEAGLVPAGSAFTSMRKQARQRLLGVAEGLLGEKLDDKRTLIVSTSGRNDFRCKGFDVYLEALSRLNRKLEADGEGGATRVLALIEVPCWTAGPRLDLAERLSGKVQPGAPLPNSFITHDLHNFDEDRIVACIRACGLDNAPQRPVKIVLAPCYLEGSDGIFNLPYYNLLSANDLTVYPSYYEPWGYTPLESCAFGVPCLTTDLSGFGQWVNEVLGHSGALSDGVLVLHRSDDNYFDVCDATANAIYNYARASASERAACKRKARSLAARAQWKHFAKHYFEAFAFASARAAKRLYNQ